MLSNTVDKQTFVGNGSTTTFTVPFTIEDNDQDEIGVILRDITSPQNPVDTLQTYGAMQNYTLSGANPPTTPFNNTVVMNVAPTVNQLLCIFRIFPLTQTLNLITGGTFDQAAIMHGMDRLQAQILTLQEQLSRAPLLAQATQKGQLSIPEPIGNYLLGFNAAGTNLQLYQFELTPTFTELEQVLAENTSNVTLVSIGPDAEIYSVFIVSYEVFRMSTNGTIREIGRLVLWWNNSSSTWSMDNPTDGGSVSGVSFSSGTIGTVGTIYMAVNNFSLGGSANIDKIRYKVVNYFLQET